MFVLLFTANVKVCCAACAPKGRLSAIPSYFIPKSVGIHSPHVSSVNIESLPIHTLNIRHDHEFEKHQLYSCHIPYLFHIF